MGLQVIVIVSCVLVNSLCGSSYTDWRLPSKYNRPGVHQSAEVSYNDIKPPSLAARQMVPGAPPQSMYPKQASLTARRVNASSLAGRSLASASHVKGHKLASASSLKGRSLANPSSPKGRGANPLPLTMRKKTSQVNPSSLKGRSLASPSSSPKGRGANPLPSTMRRKTSQVNPSSLKGRSLGSPSSPKGHVNPSSITMRKQTPKANYLKEHQFASSSLKGRAIPSSSTRAKYSKTPSSTMLQGRQIPFRFTAVRNSPNSPFRSPSLGGNFPQGGNMLASRSLKPSAVNKTSDLIVERSNGDEPGIADLIVIPHNTTGSSPETNRNLPEIAKHWLRHYEDDDRNESDEILFLQMLQHLNDINEELKDLVIEHFAEDAEDERPKEHHGYFDNVDDDDEDGQPIEIKVIGDNDVVIVGSDSQNDEEFLDHNNTESLPGHVAEEHAPQQQGPLHDILLNTTSDDYMIYIPEKQPGHEGLPGEGGFSEHEQQPGHEGLLGQDGFPGEQLSDHIFNDGAEGTLENPLDHYPETTMDDPVNPYEGENLMHDILEYPGLVVDDQGYAEPGKSPGSGDSGHSVIENPTDDEEYVLEQTHYPGSHETQDPFGTDSEYEQNALDDQEYDSEEYDSYPGSHVSETSHETDLRHEENPMDGLEPLLEQTHYPGSHETQDPFGTDSEHEPIPIDGLDYLEPPFYPGSHETQYPFGTDSEHEQNALDDQEYDSEEYYSYPGSHVSETSHETDLRHEENPMDGLEPLLEQTHYPGSHETQDPFGTDSEHEPIPIDGLDYLVPPFYPGSHETQYPFGTDSEHEQNALDDQEYDSEEYDSYPGSHVSETSHETDLRHEENPMDGLEPLLEQTHYPGSHDIQNHLDDFPLDSLKNPLENSPDLGYHPGQSTDQGHHPGQSSDQGHHPGQSAGHHPDQSHHPGQSADQGHHPGQSTDQGHHAGHHPDQGHHPGQSADQGHHPGQSTDQGHHPGHHPDQGHHPGQSTDQGHHPGQSSDQGHHPGQSAGHHPDQVHHPGQSADQGHHPGQSPGHHPDQGHQAGLPATSEANPIIPEDPLGVYGSPVDPAAELMAEQLRNKTKAQMKRILLDRHNAQPLYRQKMYLYEAE